MCTEIPNHFVSNLSIALRNEGIEHRQVHIWIETYSISKEQTTKVNETIS